MRRCQLSRAFTPAAIRADGNGGHRFLRAGAADARDLAEDLNPLSQIGGTRLAHLPMKAGLLATLLHATTACRRQLANQGLNSPSSGRLFLVFGKRKVKARPWAIIRRSPQPAAVVLKDRTANRESHAHAARFRGVESLKDLRH